MNMSVERLRIRAEKETDTGAIRKLYEQAFGGSREANLIEKLRLEPAYIRDLSLVALTGVQVTGHLLFYPVNIMKNERSTPVLSLAPMAVLPGYQNKGIGRRLMDIGLDRARRAGFGSVIAPGNAEFYRRFGFRPASRWGISSSWNLPDDGLMALELSSGALNDTPGEVAYSSVFNNA